MDKARWLAFSEEIAKVMKKYGAEISGCGCCGSAWVSIEGSVGYDDVVINSKGVHTKISGGEIHIADLES